MHNFMLHLALSFYVQLDQILKKKNPAKHDTSSGIGFLDLPFG